MKTRTRTQFTDCKAWVWRHRWTKGSCRRQEKAIETASRRQGKRECLERAQSQSPERNVGYDRENPT